MAKNTITRADALTAAIALFPEDAPEREVLTKMLVSITKPRAKSSKPSKASVENSALAVELVKVMREHGVKSVTAKWVSEHVKGVLSTQKATQVLKVAIANGDIVRFVDEKGKPHFELA